MFFCRTLKVYVVEISKRILLKENLKNLLFLYFHIKKNKRGNKKEIPWDQLSFHFHVSSFLVEMTSGEEHQSSWEKRRNRIRRLCFNYIAASTTIVLHRVCKKSFSQLQFLSASQLDILFYVLVKQPLFATVSLSRVRFLLDTLYMYCTTAAIKYNLSKNDLA